MDDRWSMVDEVAEYLGVGIGAVNVRISDGDAASAEGDNRP